MKILGVLETNGGAGKARRNLAHIVPEFKETALTNLSRPP